MKKSCSALLFSLLLSPTLVFADEVYIKGAGTICGRIVEQNATQVVVDIGGGTVGIPMANVDHIVKALSDLDVFEARAAALDPADIEGWRGLARWASARAQDTLARRAYETIVAVMPDDAEAEGALGYVLYDGQWVTREDAYRASGFVKYDGEWMLPSEAQLRLDQAREERAAREAAEQARTEEADRMQADLYAQHAAERAADDAWGSWAPWFTPYAYGYAAPGFSLRHGHGGFRRGR